MKTQKQRPVIPWNHWSRLAVFPCVLAVVLVMSALSPGNAVSRKNGVDQGKGVFTPVPEFGTPLPTFGAGGVMVIPTCTPPADFIVEGGTVDASGRPVAAVDYSDGNSGVVIGAADGSGIYASDVEITPVAYNSNASVSRDPTNGNLGTVGSRDNDVYFTLQNSSAGSPQIDVRPDLSTAGFDAGFSLHILSDGVWVVAGRQGPDAFLADGTFGTTFVEFVFDTYPEDESFQSVAVDQAETSAFLGGTVGSDGMLCKADIGTTTPIPTFGPDGTGCMRLVLGSTSTTVTGVGVLADGNIVVTGTLDDGGGPRAYLGSFDGTTGGPNPLFPLFIENVPGSIGSWGWGVDVLLDNDSSIGAAAGIVRFADPPSEVTDVLVIGFDDNGEFFQGNYNFNNTIVRAQNPTAVSVVFPQPTDPFPTIPIISLAGNSDNYSTPYFARLTARRAGLFFDDFETGNPNSWSIVFP